METAIKTLIVVSLLALTFGLDITWNRIPDITFIKDAEAIIGLPFTPLSFAGVARRTTRRMYWAGAAATTTAAASAAATDAAWTSSNYAQQQADTAQTAASQTTASAAHTASGVPIGTVVQSLPSGCVSVTVSSHEYYDCHGNFYKAAFQGNNLVYVVVPNPVQ